MNTDITDLMRTYRECARTVWNRFYYPDGWHEFEDVDEVLFRTLVCVEVSERVDWDWSRAIRVAPQMGECGLSAMWAKEDRRSYHWKELELQRSSIELRYRSFYDLRAQDDYVEHHYVQCDVLACQEHPHIVGGRLLLVAESAHFFVRVSETVSAAH